MRIPGQVSIGKNATHGYIKATASNGDTLSIWADGNSSRINSTDQLVMSVSGSNYVFRNSDIYGTNDVTDIGTSSVKFQNGYFSDSLYVGGKGQTATIKWGQMRQRIMLPRGISGFPRAAQRVKILCGFQSTEQMPFRG
jgi:hypothetical protein